MADESPRPLRKIKIRGKTVATETRRPKTFQDVRDTAARVASGVAGGLNVAGALAKAVGVVAAHIGGPTAVVTARALGAIGEHAVEAAKSLGAASSLIGGTVVPSTPPEEMTEAEVVSETVPRGRKPRRQAAE